MARRTLVIPARPRLDVNHNDPRQPEVWLAEDARLAAIAKAAQEWLASPEYARDFTKKGS